jgi:hypothetical protein
MSTRFLHDSTAWPATAPPSAPRTHAEDLAGWRDSLRRAGHACCCSASPSVGVIMPPAPGRPAVDLLFCQHHYRVHGQAVGAAGALAFDWDGAQLTPEGALLVPAGTAAAVDA